MVLVTSVIIALGVLLLAFGAFIRKDKEDAAHVLLAVGAAVFVVGFIGAGGYLAPLSGVQVSDTTTTNGETAPPGAEAKLYEVLNVLTQMWDTDSITTASGTLKFYKEDIDPNAPSAKAFESITIAAGVGNTSNAKLRQATPYIGVFDGGTLYYDMWYNNVAYPDTSELPYVVTTAGTISQETVELNGIVTVATLPDMIVESGVTGLVNGQTAVANKTTSLLEIAVGVAVTPADDDILYYNITAGDGQIYFDINIGATGSGKAAKDLVLTFENDRTNPFNGNEFTKVTLEHQSGTDFGIKSDITDEVNTKNPVLIGSFVEGGQTGVYRLTMSMEEAYLDAGADIMYIQTDDNGGYQGQDILTGIKATASDAITLAVIA